MTPRPVTSTWYGIREIETGRFLPAVSSYGFTRTEPTHDYPPRLFKEKRNATQALQRWLRGEHYEYETPTHSGEEFNERTIEIRVLPKPGRRAENMEIVVIHLQVLSLEQEALSRL